MKNYKLFKNIICNVVIGVVVITVLAVSISAGAITVSGQIKPIYKGESDKNVSLMINVYTGTEYIEPMLNVFEQYGCKTTFFIGGSWAAKNEDVLKRIYESGHEIGNHGYYNKDHKKITEQRNKEEIDINHRLIKGILGLEMKLFAPPSGSFSDTTLKVASSLGYKTIIFSADTTGLLDKTSIYNKAVKNIAGGSLILMQPTQATLAALPDIITAIKQKGLNVTPVTQALGTLAV